MTARIALVWSKGDGGFPRVVTDHPDLEVFSVDECHPDDRTYLLSTGVDRVSISAFDQLLGPVINGAGDKPAVEQAARALLARKPGGRPDLTLVSPCPDASHIFDGGKPLG